jgi:hypothetical protein
LLKVKVEDPNALRFILQDELYLLQGDRVKYDGIAAPQPQIETPPVSFNYLGANKKNFLVLVSYPAHDFIAGEHLTALESVLGRKGHTREDVAILNLAKNMAEFELLITHFNPKTLLILGEASLPAGIKQPQFNVFESIGDMNVLYTFSFDAMMNSTENKKAFWDQMKTL